MRIGRNEIIEELNEYIRQYGGEQGEWCVGTASDLATLTPTDSVPGVGHDLEEGNTPKLTYREAHTPYAATDAADYLVSAFGLHSAPGSTPGKIVFIYRGRSAHVESHEQITVLKPAA